MNRLPPPVAVFDLDGTLADTSADLIAAANACFAARGLGAPLDVQADAATAFAGGRAMLRLGHQRQGTADPAEAVEADYPRLLAFYAQALAVHTRLYPGAVAALDALAAAGWRLAVCTNKPHDLACRLLEALGISGHFAAVLGADALPVRKPDPGHLLETIRQAGGVRERAVLIGDTVTDRQAARNAGVPCALVTFGPQGRGVADLEPELLIDDFHTLPASLARLGFFA